MSPKRKDQAIYDYVATHPDLKDRSVERVAARTGHEVYDVRVLVHESSRLRMSNPGGILRWHVVELIHAEPEPAIDETP